MYNHENVTEIVEFSHHDHIPGLALALIELRKSNPNYPHPMEAVNTASSLTAWLMEEEPEYRFVAIRDGEVVGHISVSKPHDYLLNSGILEIQDNNLLEITKFFVDPRFQAHGIGQDLFQAAVKAINNENKTICLVVVETSVSAIRFYNHHGLTEEGSFNGIHGKNFVFYQFREEE